MSVGRFRSDGGTHRVLFEQKISVACHRDVRAAGDAKAYPPRIRARRDGEVVFKLLIFAVVVQESYADGGVVARARRACCLDGIAALRIALQVEFLRHTKVNVF